MKQQTSRYVALLVDRRAVTALEYGIVAGWLAFVVVIAFTNLGADLGLLIGGVTKNI